MLIVLSDTKNIPNEARFINALFDAGLRYFHLRKPYWNEKELIALIADVDPEYRSKIVLHQLHHLALDFGIKRLHFPEYMRAQTGIKCLRILKKSGHQLSTSVHTIQSFMQLDPIFDYCLAGPVFNSISKPGYLANSDWQNKEINRNSFVQKMVQAVALGGINDQNLTQVKKLGFSGAAVLGAIWANPVRSLAVYQKLSIIWN